MIEYGKRYANLVGLPRCKFSRTEECYDRMHASVPGDKLPVHNGELYLELHRGCQTTQARTKRNNRKCEWLLHNTEWLCSWAALHGMPYDHDTLNAAWRILLPTSFMTSCPVLHYEVADATGTAAYSRHARTAVGGSTTVPCGHRYNRQGMPIVVWNPCPGRNDASLRR